MVHHEPVAYLPTDEYGSTQGVMLCRDCNHEFESRGVYEEHFGGEPLPVYSWDMQPDDTCDRCLERIEDTL